MKRSITLTFSPEVVAEPIINNFGVQFGLTINIRRADISEEGGWASLELEGEEKDIEEGIAWVISRGVRVEPGGDLMSG